MLGSPLTLTRLKQVRSALYNVRCAEHAGWPTRGFGNHHHARFRHVDVLSGQIGNASPTLSRLGRNLAYFHATNRGWKLFAADIKSACLQTDYITEEGLRIFGNSSGVMRRRMERIMGPQSHQVLRMLKPALGDARTPRLWNDTLHRVMLEFGYLPRRLEQRLYLSSGRRAEPTMSLRSSSATAPPARSTASWACTSTST